MGRLTTLKPTLTKLRPSIAWMPEGERERDQHRATLPWRKRYNTKRWKDLRWRVLLRDKLTCQMCMKRTPPQMLVADHKRPHKGDERLFWDEQNVQACCKPCHDGEKQRQERAMI